MKPLRIMRGILSKLAFTLVTLISASPSTAADQCIRMFSAMEPTGRQHFIKQGEMAAFSAQLQRNNRANQNVHSIAIFRDDSNPEVVYTVLNGSSDPIYKGSRIQELAEAIDDASTAAGANSVYVSLAGFSPKKAAGMQSTMNMQWAHLDAKPKLIIRVPHVEQAGIDVALPREFFLPNSGISEVTKVTTVERMTRTGGKNLFHVMVEFIVSMNATSQKFAVRFVVRTKQMHQQLERIIVRLRPEWLAKHASAAEVVSQVMAQMKRANPKMLSSDFRVEILNQVDGTRFVEENRVKGRENARNG